MRERACMPLLSIIIPVFNRQRRFDRLCQSLSHSIRFADAELLVEVIVVDDGSDRPVATRYLPANHVLLRHEENRGAPISRQLGYQHSHGQFVHFHDSDDRFHEQWVSLVTDKIQETPSMDILISGRKNMADDYQRYVYQQYLDNYADKLTKIRKRLLYRNCFGPLGGVTFSRKVLAQVSFKPMASCQDWQMYVEAMPAVKKIVSCPQIRFYFYTSGEDRISHQPRKKLLGHLQLAHSTVPQSVFGRPLRLYYLMTWKRCFTHASSSHVQAFYKQHKVQMWFWYVLITLYWRIS